MTPNWSLADNLLN